MNEEKTTKEFLDLNGRKEIEEYYSKLTKKQLVTMVSNTAEILISMKRDKMF